LRSRSVQVKFVLLPLDSDHEVVIFPPIRSRPSSVLSPSSSTGTTPASSRSPSPAVMGSRSPTMSPASSFSLTPAGTRSPSPHSLRHSSVSPRPLTGDTHSPPHHHAHSRSHSGSGIHLSHTHLFAPSVTASAKPLRAASVSVSGLGATTPVSSLSVSPDDVHADSAEHLADANVVPQRRRCKSAPTASAFPSMPRVPSPCSTLAFTDDLDPSDNVSARPIATATPPARTPSLTATISTTLNSWFSASPAEVTEPGQQQMEVAYDEFQMQHLNGSLSRGRERAASFVGSPSKRSASRIFLLSASTASTSFSSESTSAPPSQQDSPSIQSPVNLAPAVASAGLVSRLSSTHCACPSCQQTSIRDADLPFSPSPSCIFSGGKDDSGTIVQVPDNTDPNTTLAARRRSHSGSELRASAGTPSARLFPADENDALPAEVQSPFSSEEMDACVFMYLRTFNF
jgi:hypothetical protein